MHRIHYQPFSVDSFRRFGRIPSSGRPFRFYWDLLIVISNTVTHDCGRASQLLHNPTHLAFLALITRAQVLPVFTYCLPVSGIILYFIL